MKGMESDNEGFEGDDLVVGTGEDLDAGGDDEQGELDE